MTASDPAVSDMDLWPRIKQAIFSTVAATASA